MPGIHLGSECLKYWYDRWTVTATCSTCLLIPILVATLENLTGAQGAGFARTQLLQGIYLGQAGLSVVSALYFGREFERSALRTSLLSTPRRLAFLACKGVCLLGSMALLLAVATAASALVLCLCHAVTLPDLLSEEVLLALAPACLSAIELCAIAASLAVICRSAVVPSAVMLSMVLGLGQLLLQFGSVFRFLPVICAMDAFLPTPSGLYPSLWDGLLLQGLWCTGLLTLAAMALRLRSVR